MCKQLPKLLLRWPSQREWRRQLAEQENAGGGVTAMLLTALQFHLPFYLSRTLPNILAMPLTNAGLAAWLAGGASPAPIYLLTAAAVIFRCDMLLLVGLVGLRMLASRRTSLARGVAHGARRPRWRLTRCSVLTA